MVVKSFRGLLADGGQERISLGTIKGKVGYRIIKFQVIHAAPGQEHVEGTMKIYRAEQSTINNDIDFSDSSLLGAAYLAESDDHANALGQIIVFDNEIFNQDIYITLEDTVGSQPMNYYLELEQFVLASDEATVATLKDIKLNA